MSDEIQVVTPTKDREIEVALSPESVETLERGDKLILKFTVASSGQTMTVVLRPPQNAS